jgi:hypothetical protein
MQLQSPLLLSFSSHAADAGRDRGKRQSGRGGEVEKELAEEIGSGGKVELE